MKKRIIGIDVARALAIIGMIIVNFKIAFGDSGNPIIKSIIKLLEGKAAATFVVLAGIGLAFMSKSALNKNNVAKIRSTKIRILKRAIFLFVVGLLYIPIWEADILHFYGVYMLVVLLVLTYSNRTILATAFFLIFLYPVLMLIWDYDINWDYSSFSYSNFWTFRGFITNLFFNGFHPVIPWSSFMLVGLWFGRQDLTNAKFLKNSIWISLGIFITCLVISKTTISVLGDNDPQLKFELIQIIGTSPMPPLPIYMISGSSFAIFIVSVCVIISQKFEDKSWIQLLKKTGQLALTFYVAHVVIGMIIVYLIDPGMMGHYSIEFSFFYALAFSLICMIFAYFWSKKHMLGPLEWLMRKITG